MEVSSFVGELKRFEEVSFAQSESLDSPLIAHQLTLPRPAIPNPSTLSFSETLGVSEGILLSH